MAASVFEYRGYKISITKWNRKVDPYMPIVETPDGKTFAGDLNSTPGKALAEGRRKVDTMILTK